MTYYIAIEFKHHNTARSAERWWRGLPPGLASASIRHEGCVVLTFSPTQTTRVGATLLLVGEPSDAIVLKHYSESNTNAIVIHVYDHAAAPREESLHN